MRRIITVLASFFILAAAIPVSIADVVSSDEAISIELNQYNKQQLLSYIARDEVQSTLVALGVDTSDAQSRIANMTDFEIASLNAQIQDMPAAAGIGGTIVTVLIVIAVLDMLGVTDVFSFIDPIV